MRIMSHIPIEGITEIYAHRTHASKHKDCILIFKNESTKIKKVIKDTKDTNHNEKSSEMC